MTRGSPAVAQNRAERVSSCESCGRPIVAGRRGPLPRRHRHCRPPDEQLLYAVRSAARLAHSSGRQAVGFELDAIAAVLQVNTPRQPSAPEPAAIPARTPPPAGEWTRFGE